MKAAVIGIGSNSVRCLLAETGEDGFTCLWRDREGTRLFAGLDERGNLSRESMDKTVAAVARMASEVRHQRGKRRRERGGIHPGGRGSRGDGATDPARKRGSGAELPGRFRRGKG